LSSNHLNKIWTGPEVSDPKPIIYLGGDAFKFGEEALKVLRFCCVSYFQMGANAAYRDSTFELFRKYGIRAFLDSGAFSYQMQVLKKNQPLDRKAAEIIIDQYAEWVFRYTNEFTFDFLVTFDYLRDAEVVSWTTQRLQNRGLHPVPVYHLNSPLTALRRLVDQGYTLIGIGGLAGNTSGSHHPTSKPYAKSFLDQVFSLTERLRVRCHGFGIGGQIIADYPWFSVDSTSWSHYARRGMVNQTSHNPQKLFDAVPVSSRISGARFSEGDDTIARAVQNIKFWSTLTDRRRPPVKRGLF
jgi:hypothetical protein